MDIRKIIDYWLEGAEKDWLACKHLFENKDYPQCLFWAHLVLEKLLKAHVVRHTKTQAPYSHDLVLLASKTDLQLTPEQKDALNEITTFNQFGRYDNEIVDFANKCTPEYSTKYFIAVKELQLWLKKSLQNGK